MLRKAGRALVAGMGLMVVLVAPLAAHAVTSNGWMATASVHIAPVGGPFWD